MGEILKKVICGLCGVFIVATSCNPVSTNSEKAIVAFSGTFATTLPSASSKDTVCHSLLFTIFKTGDFTASGKTFNLKNKKWVSDTTDTFYVSGKFDSSALPYSWLSVSAQSVGNDVFSQPFFEYTVSGSSIWLYSVDIYLPVYTITGNLQWTENWTGTNNGWNRNITKTIFVSDKNDSICQTFISVGGLSTSSKFLQRTGTYTQDGLYIFIKYTEKTENTSSSLIPTTTVADTMKDTLQYEILDNKLYVQKINPTWVLTNTNK